MKTYFTRIDFDKDGSITRKDFDSMASRFAEKSKMNADCAATLKSHLTAIWDKFLSGGKEAVTQADFVAQMAKNVKDPAMKGCIEGPLPLFFSAIDDNNDGMISGDEFGLFFELLGMDKAMAPSSFQAIDTNNDGLLSLEEFTQAGSEFFFSEDPALPTKLFWGPLV